jgi:hypothetical protein
MLPARSIVTLTALLLAAPALGADSEGDGDAELQIEDSAILPSAEGHTESRAPTMDIDCEADPEACEGEPILTPTEGPPLSRPSDSDPLGVEAGEPVPVDPTETATGTATETPAETPAEAPAAD